MQHKTKPYLRWNPSASLGPLAPRGIAAGWILVGLLSHTVWGQSQFPPLSRTKFKQAAPQGFGDRQNSWAWSMEWYQGKLFVGTGRALGCLQALGWGTAMPSTNATPNSSSLTYPPTDPDISCPLDPADLPLQAEIWSWDPATTLWTRVYQSPGNVPIPNTSPQKYTARDVAYRGMGVFTEPDGTQALYVSGCSATGAFPGMPAARLLRTTDGVNFNAVPHAPGTFLGNLGNECFRGIETYNNKMYIVTVNPSLLLESSNPKLGGNAFQSVGPASPRGPFEIAPYNGFLYVSFYNNTTGFNVLKTNAQGTPPYTFTTIIPNGGYQTLYPNRTILSMLEFNGSLYLGGANVNPANPLTAQGAEIFRIKADDSWDLIVGQSRSTPVGQKNALSGFGPGFNWCLNAQMWRMEIFDGRLYVGTYDESTTRRNNPTYGSRLTPELGFDHWYTSDGVTFHPIDIRGFEDQFNSGIRTLKATPFGLFVGTANFYYGLQVWQGTP